MRASPVAQVAATSTTRRNSFTGTEIENLKATARTILHNCGIEYGPNKINRLCTRFAERVERNGFAFFTFIANAVHLSAEQRRGALADPDIARVISWADPTGETAVNNVLREGVVRLLVEQKECRPVAGTGIQVAAEAEHNSTAIRSDYALLVTTGLRTGGVRRHVYFNTPSAQKAVERGESRGVPVSVRLVRLVPTEVTIDATTVPAEITELIGGGDR